MRIYLNAQFSSGKRRDRLLSVGMVSEAGGFYRVVSDSGAIAHGRWDAWLRVHVLSRLPYDEEGADWNWDSEHPDHGRIVEEHGLVDDLLDFVDAHPEPEFWGWHSSFAYVAVRHLFGKLNDRPANFPSWCGELAAKWAEAGRPELPPRGEAGHHALEMARWARDADALIEQRLVEVQRIADGN